MSNVTINGKEVSSCGYLQGVLTSQGMTSAVNRVVKNLKPIVDTFDAIAFRGMSGALVAPNAAQRLKKDVIAVRKGEDRHSMFCVEGVISQRYVIVDDFIDGGNTINAIHDAVKKWHKPAKLVGIALYNTDYISPYGEKFIISNDRVCLIHRGINIPIYSSITQRSVS